MINFLLIIIFQDKSYHDRLSDASKETLKFQGGALTEEEANEFESQEFFNPIVKMRLWDDKAKDDQLNLAANNSTIENYLKKYKSALNELISNNLK